MKAFIAISGGINWNWYARIEMTDGEAVTITHEGRIHKDYDNEFYKRCKEDGNHRYRIIEKEHQRSIEPYSANNPFPPRIAIAVEIDGIQYPIEHCERFSFPELFGALNCD